jgi:hypothetical protein
MNLRPYQAQLVTDIRLQYQQGRRSVLAVLATGGGNCYDLICSPPVTPCLNSAALKGASIRANLMACAECTRSGCVAMAIRITSHQNSSGVPITALHSLLALMP